MLSWSYSGRPTIMKLIREIERDRGAQTSWDKWPEYVMRLENGYGNPPKQRLDFLAVPLAEGEGHPRGERPKHVIVGTPLYVAVVPEVQGPEMDQLLKPGHSSDAATATLSHSLTRTSWSRDQGQLRARRIPGRHRRSQAHAQQHGP